MLMSTSNGLNEVQPLHDFFFTFTWRLMIFEGFSYSVNTQLSSVEITAPPPSYLRPRGLYTISAVHTSINTGWESYQHVTDFSIWLLRIPVSPFGRETEDHNVDFISSLCSPTLSPGSSTFSVALRVSWLDRQLSCRSIISGALAMCTFVSGCECFPANVTVLQYKVTRGYYFKLP